MFAQTFVSAAGINSDVLSLLGKSYDEIVAIYGNPSMACNYGGGSLYYFDGFDLIAAFENTPPQTSTDFVDYNSPIFVKPSGDARCVKLNGTFKTIFPGFTASEYTCAEIEAITGIAIPSFSFIGDYGEGDAEYCSYVNYHNAAVTLSKHESGDTMHTDATWFEAVLTSGNGFYIPAEAPKSISVFIDNEELLFDQPPIIEEGRTLVPARAIFEAFHLDVDWNGATQTVKASNSERDIILRIDDTTAYVDGEVHMLDVPARIINDRTLVPARFIAESLNCDVFWNGDEQRVDIVTK